MTETTAPQITTTREQKIAKAKAFTAARTTKILVQSVLALETQCAAERTKAEETGDYGTCQALHLTRSWIIEALEARFPAAEQAVEAAFDAAADDENVHYVNVLVANIPEADKR